MNSSPTNLDTISAISTPPGSGAIAIVRISGPLAFEIACKIFSSSQDALLPVNLRGNSHKAMHGFILQPQTQICVDDVVLIPYKDPASYTGEDLVEINCHGSPVIAREILELILSLGARLARPGEFTQRAYLSGKMDLTQAEAVMDLIQAKTKSQSRQAQAALSGQIGSKISNVRSDLVELLTRITAGIDFPEEVGEVSLDDLERIVVDSKVRLTSLAQTMRAGRFLREGLRVSIVGQPNVGKSSLLNQFLKFERAIVTEIPGTTRDSIEELVELAGVPVLLVDTAGIRNTQDRVEQIGIDRTVASIEQADLVLFMIDGSKQFDHIDKKIESMISEKPFIMVKNKLDLGDAKNKLPEDAIDQISISAKSGDGMDQLGDCLSRFVFSGSQDKGASVNERQGELCLKALQSLVLLEQAVSDDFPQDCLATDLKEAIIALSQACGTEVSEEVITQVFARFCIGK
ncbi:MAG: tRNA uridine-5-carboxymethylaminomethyl(34) synthesis GTPase MnmE [Candidatus Melainabacteria bacterium]|nr:MAG: tRNA uridine-5-carboxymethylaminomethyl(34) synthesis GTPase MnmE [Candidatus Melainabacteria bacterium]